MVLEGSNAQHKIRLSGIDCPERKQPWSTRAKQARFDQVFDHQVTVDRKKYDRYKRIVGKVLDGKRDGNLALVRDGLCWWYRTYASEQSAVDRVLYEDAQYGARRDRRGSGSDQDPIPPWEWRRRWDQWGLIACSPFPTERVIFCPQFHLTQKFGRGKRPIDLK